MSRRVDKIEDADVVSLAVDPRTLSSIDLSNTAEYRGIPVWAYKAARKAVDEWCDGRWAGWRLDAIAWHAARYLLDEQSKYEARVPHAPFRGDD